MPKALRYFVYAFVVMLFSWPVAVFVFFLVATGIFHNETDAELFVREKWLQPVAEEQRYVCIRGRMSADLIENHLKVGMPRELVYEMLGEPSDVKGRLEEYYIGFCRGSMDPDGIVLEYDANQELIRAYLIQH